MMGLAETGYRGVIPYHEQVSRRLCEAYKVPGHTNIHAEKRYIYNQNAKPVAVRRNSGGLHFTNNI